MDVERILGVKDRASQLLAMAELGFQEKTATVIISDFTRDFSVFQ